MHIEDVTEFPCPYCKQVNAHDEECPEALDFEDTPEMEEVEIDYDALPFID